MADVLAYGLLLIALIVVRGLDLRTRDEVRKLRDLHHKSQLTL